MYVLFSIFQGSDGEESLQNLPLLSDSTFIPTMHRKISNVSQRWNHTGIQSVTQFAWSMTLATLR